MIIKTQTSKQELEKMKPKSLRVLATKFKNQFYLSQLVKMRLLKQEKLKNRLS